MAEAFFWMTHGHRPQQQALLAVKRAFGERVGTLGSRTDGKLEFAPADRVMAEPAGDAEFVRMVADTARELRAGAGDVPVVVVAMGRRRELLAEAAGLSAAGVTLLAGCRDVGVLDMCEDKFLFAEWMRANFPRHALPTRLVASPDELLDAVGAVEATGSSACVKPPVGVFGMGFWHLSRETPPSAVFTGSLAFEERRMLNPGVFEAAYRADPRPLVVMPFLAGTEISIDAVFRSGGLVRAATRRKRGSLQAVAEDAEDVLPILRPLGASLGLDGIVNVQVRRETPDGDGPYLVLEINTRYSGGSAYLLDAGIDLFSEALCSVTGAQPPRSAVVPLLDIASRAAPASPLARWDRTA